MIVIDDSKIDWRELRAHKLTLGIVSNEYRKNKKEDIALALDGIKHLIDFIQDSAVESGIYTVKEVFDLEDENETINESSEKGDK